MLQYSTKRKLLISLDKEIMKRRALQSALSILLGSEDEETDNESDATMECNATIDDLITEGIEEAHIAISNKRYAFPSLTETWRKKIKKMEPPFGFQMINF